LLFSLSVVVWLLYAFRGSFGMVIACVMGVIHLFSSFSKLAEIRASSSPTGSKAYGEATNISR